MTQRVTLTGYNKDNQQVFYVEYIGDFWDSVHILTTQHEFLQRHDYLRDHISKMNLDIDYEWAPEFPDLSEKPKLTMKMESLHDILKRADNGKMQP